MNRTTLLALTLCTVAAPTLLAQGTSVQRTEAGLTSVPTNARAFKRMKVPGDQVEKNVKRLLAEVRIHKTLRGALSAGRAQGKPVIWIHALGDVDGFL